MRRLHLHHKFAWAVSIFFLALAVRLSIAITTHLYSAAASGEALSVARQIAHAGAFANPFNVETGPTAHVAPVYPSALSLLVKLFPDESALRWALIIASSVGTALIWSLLPACAAALGMEYSVGIIAGLYGAIWPFRHAVELAGCWEAAWAGLALMGLAIITLRFNSGNMPARRALWLGTLWGAGMLLEPSLFPTFLGVLLLIGISMPSRRAAFRTAVLALAAMALVITPWIIRDYYRLGGFVFIRDNLGLELSVSNNANAFPNVHENLHFNPKSDHPDMNPVERQRMAKMGELAYNHHRLQLALSWIAANRRRFLELTAERFAYFWAPKRRSVALRAIEALNSAAALLGLLILLRRRTRAGGILLTIWLTYPVIYYVIQADERYRYPMEWSITLCVAYFAMWLYRRITSRRTPRREHMAYWMREYVSR